MVGPLVDSLVGGVMWSFDCELGIRLKDLV